MAESGIRLRLIIIVFTLACLSVGFSSVLLLSHFWASPAKTGGRAASDPFVSIEENLKASRSAQSWDELNQLSMRAGFIFGARGIKLIWDTWKQELRIPELRDIASRIYQNSRSDDDRVLIAYLLLETGQGDTIARLSKQGSWTNMYPNLEAEIAQYRQDFVAPQFTALNVGGFSADTRLELDRALAWGYLGDFSAARLAATRVVDATQSPGQNGSTGMIDPDRGLCRRQVARMIQIMSVWDAAEPAFESLMHAAFVELMIDPFGMVRVAPGYFDLLCDTAAWNGDRSRLERLFAVADTERHVLADEQRENRSLLAQDASLRPETHADLRRLLATFRESDPRGLIPEITDAATRHDDQRSWRLVAWYLLHTADWDGLDRLLSRTTIQHGPWHALYEAIVAEKNGDLVAAYSGYQGAQSGTLANIALLNQARILLRQGRVETAAVTAAAARQGIEVRSIGLVHRVNSPYASLFADTLALQSRILRAQGRETEAQALLRLLAAIRPDHPELFNATGLAIKPETGMEIQQ